MSAKTRRDFLRQLSAGGVLTLSNWRAFAAEALPPGVARLVEQFVIEALPEGGVDRSKSIWQKPGRGAAVGGRVFEGGIDPRYFRFEVEALYRIARLTGDDRCRRVADAHVQYMARAIGQQHPMWALGNALELFGLYAEEHRRDTTKAARWTPLFCKKTNVFNGFPHEIVFYPAVSVISCLFPSRKS